VTAPSVAATGLILFAAAVNLAPVGGALSSDRLQAAYGVAFTDPNLVILMRHRAVLFAVVGGLLAVAAFHAPLRRAAYVAGFLSMLSFLLILVGVGGYNPELRRIAVVDAVASLALLGALALERLGRSPGARPL
jgi:hypothetical protein